MNRFLAASVIGLLLLAMLATGVYFYQRYSIILLDPMRAVPADAALIVEIKKPGEAMQEFFSGPFRKSISDDPWVAGAEKSFSRFDSLLREEGGISDIWEDQSVVVSTHLIKAGKFDFLYLTNLPRGWTEQKLKRFIEKGWSVPDKISRREYENVNIYETQLNDSMTFTFASTKSVAIFSASPLLVEQAVRQLNDGSSITQSKAFLKVVPASSDDGFIRVYFNNQSLKDIATSVTTDDNNNFFRLASTFARWNGFTVNSEEEFFSLKGSTVTFDSTSHLSFFRNQKAQTMNMAAIAPSRTALLFEFGLSNFADYYNHLRANAGLPLDAKDQKKILQDLQEKFGTDFERAFTSWIGNEMALIITEPAGSAFENNAFGCVKANNVSDAINQLNNIRDAVANHDAMPVSEEKYRNHAISTIHVKGIIPLLYGKIFSGLNGCSYTSINDYIVFSNQPASLKTLIDEHEENKMLSKDPAWMKAAGHLEAEGNARLFVSPQRALNLYRPDNFHSFLSAIYRSTGIHAQWNNSGATLKAQLVFDFHKKTMKEPVLYWATQLDTVLSSIPVTVKEGDGHSYVYVQDAKNNFYKLDESGTVVWKKTLEEKILSRIFPVDIYRDGRRQLLFNTPSRLVLLDADGNNTGNYPIRLPATATNGCSVISTTSGYITYVACSNHYMYAYDAGGKPVPDWNYLKTATTISKPVQAFTVMQNTWLVISGDSGMVMLTDRKGNQKTSFASQFVQSSAAGSYLWKSDSTGTAEFMTTDTSGRIILFTPGGTVKKIETGGFTGIHEFILLKDITTQEQRVIFLDEQTLFLVNAEGETMTSKISSGISHLVSIIALPDGSSGIMATADDGRFYVLNQKGETEKGFPLKGNLHPVISELNRIVIICGNSDGILYCYKTD